MTAQDQQVLVEAYLKALAENVEVEEVRELFHEQMVQAEYPNRLNPSGGRSDLETILARMEQGKSLLQRQSYTMKSFVAQGDTAAVEAEWEGVLAIPIAGLQSGEVMRAHFAMFFRFKEGKIIEQRNYDCFEPW